MGDERPADGRDDDDEADRRRTRGVQRHGPSVRGERRADPSARVRHGARGYDPDQVRRTSRCSPPTSRRWSGARRRRGPRIRGSRTARGTPPNPRPTHTSRSRGGSPACSRRPTARPTASSSRPAPRPSASRTRPRSRAEEARIRASQALVNAREESDRMLATLAERRETMLSPAARDAVAPARHGAGSRRTSQSSADVGRPVRRPQPTGAEPRRRDVRGWCGGASRRSTPWDGRVERRRRDGSSRARPRRSEGRRPLTTITRRPTTRASRVCSTTHRADGPSRPWTSPISSSIEFDFDESETER